MSGSQRHNIAREAGRRAKARLDDFDTFQKVVAAIGAAGLLYVLGGIAMLLRLLQANLAVEESLTVISRNDLLVLGIREFAAGLLLAVVCYLLTAWSPVVYYTTVGCLALLAPWTLAGGFWVISLLAIGVVSHRARQPRAGAWKVWFPVIVLGLSTVAVLTRYFDPPGRFDSVGVYVQGDTTAGALCSHTDQNGTWPNYCGAYLGSDSDNVYLARPLDETVAGAALVVIVPRSSVQKILLFPASKQLRPSESIVGWVMRHEGQGNRAVECDALECWVGDSTFGNQLFG